MTNEERPLRFDYPEIEQYTRELYEETVPILMEAREQGDTRSMLYYSGMTSLLEHIIDVYDAKQSMNGER